MYLQGTKEGGVASSAAQITRARRATSANDDSEPEHQRRPDRSQAEEQRRARRRRGGRGERFIVQPSLGMPKLDNSSFEPTQSRPLVNGHSPPALYIIFLTVIRRKAPGGIRKLLNLSSPFEVNKSSLFASLCALYR